MNVPSDLKYTKSHEWVRFDDGIATVGITDYAQSELGDIVFVELPPVGKSFQVGDSMGTVESVKTVSDYYAPVAGEIAEVNQDLSKSSELMNEDPYGKGWVLRLRVKEEGDLEKLMDDHAYMEVIS